MTDKHIRKILISLIRISLGKEEFLHDTLDTDEWKEVADFAMAQSVMGVLMPAIEKLDEKSELPLGVYSLWVVTSESIRERYSSLKDRAAELASETATEGHRCCILKGAGIAELYPEPALRQSGDIDIWVEGGTEQVLSCFRSRYKVRNICYHHFEARIFKGVSVEVHTTPTWFNSFPKNKRLQEWFAGQAGRQFDNFNEELGFAVPELPFQAVHAIIHVLRHFLFEGVGLRQIMDCYYILDAVSDTERKDIIALLRRFKLERFCAALMFLLGEVFGLEKEKMLCEPDEVLGKRLLDEVLTAGDFGHCDHRNRIKRSDTVVIRAFKRLSRLARYSAFCPSEILWAPVFKTWQFFWKKNHMANV